MTRSRCTPEHYASGWQCSGCGCSWGEDGPDECPHEPLADDPPSHPVSLDELHAAMKREGWTVAHADDVARERAQTEER